MYEINESLGCFGDLVVAVIREMKSLVAKVSDTDKKE